MRHMKENSQTLPLQHLFWIPLEKKVMQSLEIILSIFLQVEVETDNITGIRGGF